MQEVLTVLPYVVMLMLVAAVLTLRHKDGKSGVAFWSDPEPYDNHTFTRRQLLQREQQANHGHLSSIGRKSFTESMIEQLNGQKPGHYLPYKERKRASLRSSANDRAREGFRYWIVEKPVNKGGKYTTGARTTFLGLGKSHYP